MCFEEIEFLDISVEIAGIDKDFAVLSLNANRRLMVAVNDDNNVAVNRAEIVGKLLYRHICPLKRLSIRRDRFDLLGR